MISKLFKPFYLVLILIALLFSFLACQPTSSIQKNPIRSAHSDWTEEGFQTEIVNLGLEQLGYQIEPSRTMDYISTYLAVANGDLDYSVVNYKLAHNRFFNQAGGNEKMERVGVLVDRTVKGYQIDKKTADEYNITNIQQLQDPKLAQLFDSDGNGKANLVGCNPGWFCEKIVDHHLEAYDLNSTVEQKKGLYLSLLEEVVERYEQGDRVLYYAYNPHWISEFLKPGEDVIWLEVPFTSFIESQKKISPKNTIVDGKNLGFTIDSQHVFANNKFLQANPTAKRWFELVQIPLEDMNAESLLIQQGEDSPDDIARHARKWVAQHQELFDRWLAEAQLARSN